MKTHTLRSLASRHVLRGWRGALAVAFLLALGLSPGPALLAPGSAPAQSLIDKVFGMSTEEEVRLGREISREVERKLGVVYQPDVATYVNDLGQRLVRHSQRANLPHAFKVVKEPSVNAFALPGGFVYVHLGLIAAAESEMELAGVLAHEIGHVSGHHHSEQLAKSQAIGLGTTLFGALVGGATQRMDIALVAAELVATGAYMKFSRDAEREADQLGVQMLHRAGWNPRGMVSFFDKLEEKRLERGMPISGVDVFFSTHPTPVERRANVEALIQGLPPDPGLVRDTPAFQRARAVVRRMLNLPTQDPQGTRPKPLEQKLPPFLRPGPQGP